MLWNPEIYEQFKKERSAPFFDLLHLTEPISNLLILDLGCGTGEYTSKLSDYFKNARISGIDTSEEMLVKAKKFQTRRLQFIQRSIEEQLCLNDKFDLIFSNAAIQWCSHHRKLFPKIISKINKNGQLAVQIPSNHAYVAHQLLKKTAEKIPYKTACNGWQRKYTVLKTEDYARILFENKGRQITVFEKVFPHILDNSEAVFQWMSGTALLPYIEKLPENLKESFKADYKAELQNIFPESPVFYPFKRIFIYAKF